MHGAYPIAAVLGMLWGSSELLLTIFKRSKSNAVSKDRHSLGLIWLVILTSVALAIPAAHRLPSFQLPWPRAVLTIGFALFVLGAILRWYAILYLGRFFTTNVAIAADHRVIDSGPYRFIRHPSYTGSLLAILGLGLSFQNWAALVILFVPSCAVTLWRIHIEEAALSNALGAAYRDYMGRTKRLLPGVY